MVRGPGSDTGYSASIAPGFDRGRPTLCESTDRSLGKWLRFSLAIAALALLHSSLLPAQGVLTVTPGRSAAPLAGTGAVGYTGDNGPSAGATLALPAAIAYDAAGNLFLADANNHAVREVTPAGVITTVAGTGTAGFSGDGGPATAALLDTPTGVAVDAAGNLYIADSHNARIRKVSGGIVTTAAGTGTVGFSGDGGPGTSAQLALPSAVALDANGNLYIADTNNNCVRKLSGTTITTVAGTTEQFFTGDGGLAVQAALDHPTGIAVDASSNLYIADRQNHRIRVVSSSTGRISTLAGGAAGLSFAGDFSGDGGNSAAATLARPTGVSVDATGSVYVADTNNGRVRQISGGIINTILGTGDQGLAGNGGPATAAILNSPRAASPDAAGNLAVADTLNQQVRFAALGTLSFGVQAPGTSSPAPQPVTLANTGNGSLTVQGAAASGALSLAGAGTCGSFPLSLVAGQSCTRAVAFSPTALANTTGALTVTGAGVTTQTVLLSGLTDSLAIQPSPLQITYGSPSTPVTASVAFSHPQPVPPNGPVSFSIDAASPVTGACTPSGSSLSCSATLTTGALSVGAAHTLQAQLGIYAGTANVQVTLPATTVPVCTLGAAQVLSASASTFTLTLPASCSATPSQGLTTTIDWGDGTPRSTLPNPATHTYLNSGTYIITLTGIEQPTATSPQQIGAASEAITVTIPPPIAAGATTSSATTLGQQITPIAPTAVSFVCTSVTATLADGTTLPPALPSLYGIACSPFTATVSSTSSSLVTITVSTTSGGLATNASGGRARTLLAELSPVGAVLLLLGGVCLPRRRRATLRVLGAGGALCTLCLTLCSCGGGSFTPPPVTTTRAGTYYVTVNELVTGAVPTGFVQTSLIVPLTVTH